MTKLSFALLASAMATLVAGQIAPHSAVPILAQTTSGCGGCYLVADVAGIVFGGVTTQTVQQSIGVPKNGTARITTAIVYNTGLVSFTSGGVIPNEAQTSFNLFDSTIEVGGAILTSPISYEVFSAYSITSYANDDNGNCVAVPGTATSLTSAFKYSVGSNPAPDVLLQGESAFIEYLKLTCSAAGGKVANTVHSMIKQSTLTATAPGPQRPSPLAANTGGSVTPTLAPSTTAPASIAVQTTVIVYSNGTGAASGSGAAITTLPFAVGAAENLVPTWMGRAIALACGLAVWLL